METTLIQRGQWKHYLDVVSRIVEGQDATVEIIGGDIGAQQEGPLRMTGLEYEEKKGSLWFHTRELSHEVAHPRSMSALQEGLRVRALEIEDADGTRFVFRFSPPVALPRE